MGLWRHEVANNSYARGITLTLANDVVGTGPRLQMLTSDDAANRFVEVEFFAWCEAVGLAEKLRFRDRRFVAGIDFVCFVYLPCCVWTIH